MSAPAVTQGPSIPTQGTDLSPDNLSHNRDGSMSAGRVSPSACAQCSRQGPENPRNIIVCIDGTSNRFRQNTNVVKVFSMINLETTSVPQQYAYYVSGVGTKPKPLNILKGRKKRTLSDKIDMAIGWKVELLVIDAYAWLARTYRAGDQVYLFGFSRGAYQVRLLAAMIHEVGLIRAATDDQIGTAYDHYDAIRSKEPNARLNAAEFKNMFSWKNLLRVHFIGVWDTVSSVGLIKKDIFLSCSSSATHACHFRHALALDEHRVKFMPEYFHEMNSQMYDSKSKYSPTSKKRGFSVVYDIPHPDESDERKGVIKEVWFAGSHGDVGGMSKPRWPYRAGNVSLLWMRREAAEEGLMLHPTDIVWVPDELDFGVSNSMDIKWRFMEYLPIKHQTSFSGIGEHSRRWHLLQPRRIIPGQKIHASILYANTYKPRATLGDGFDISIIHAEPEDPNLDDDVWEKRLFDHSAAKELLDYLRDQQGAAPQYLDRLLFLLRFKEGKQYVTNIPDWEERFKFLIEQSKSPLVRFVALVAYYEAAARDDHQMPQIDLDDHVFDDARKCLKNILDKHRHRDVPRVVTLLKSMTKHEILRKRILTEEILKNLATFIDPVLSQKHPGDNFGPVMDGLNCLLRCEDTRKIASGILMGPSQHIHHQGSRLSCILEFDDPHILSVALRMVLTFAHIPEVSPAKLTREVQQATMRLKRLMRLTLWQMRAERVAKEAMEKQKIIDFWAQVKPRIMQLAGRRDRLVGRLAVQVLFALYVKGDNLDLLNSRVGVNVASALVYLKYTTDSSDDREGRRPETTLEQQTLRLFGLGASELEPTHVRFIAGLRKAVKYGDPWERTAGTLTLLELCKADQIRTHLCRKRLLDVFIDQLQRKDSALLAARALATCLEYGVDLEDMKVVINKDLNGLLSKNIVGMLQLDYFDDAAGKKEGFQIFADLMKHQELREKIKTYSITKLLEIKLTKGERKETRTSLICLDILLEYGKDPEGPWARELVDNSLKYLGDRTWETQKLGVLILSALAQTKKGADAVRDSIVDIIKLLLREHRTTEPGTPTGPVLAHSPVDIKDSPVHDSRLQMPVGPSSPQGTEGEAKESENLKSTLSPGTASDVSSWMLGPACALRILAQNDTLRKYTHDAQEYHELKNLHLTGTLVGDKDPSPLHIWTPNRSDVIDMLDNMIKSIDGEISEESLMSTGVPDISHADRLLGLLRDRVVGVTLLPALLGLSILAAAVVPPIYLSGRLFGRLKWLLRRRRYNRMLDDLCPQQTSLDAGGDNNITSTGHHNNGGPLRVLQRLLASLKSTRGENSPAGLHDGAPSCAGHHEDSPRDENELQTK